MEKAVELLQADVSAGEFFEGELMEVIPKIDAVFFPPYSDELKGSIRGRKQSPVHSRHQNDEQAG